MAIVYSDAFKCQLKRLSRRYRRIRSDIQPIIEQLEAGETPGDQIQGRGYTVYKVRVRNPRRQTRQERRLQDHLLPENRNRYIVGDDLLENRSVRYRSR